MGPAMDAKRAWVIQVFGVDPLYGEPEGAPEAEPDLLAIWRDAKETVDAQLAALQKALAADEDPDFGRLVKSGLFALGTKENVSLLSSLHEFRNAPAEAKTEQAARVLDAVRDYTDLLAKSRIPAVLDENPFGVEVKVRATLNAALAKIDTVVR